MEFQRAGRSRNYASAPCAARRRAASPKLSNRQRPASRAMQMCGGRTVFTAVGRRRRTKDGFSRCPRSRGHLMRAIRHRHRATTAASAAPPRGTGHPETARKKLTSHRSRSGASQLPPARKRGGRGASGRDLIERPCRFTAPSAAP